MLTSDDVRQIFDEMSASFFAKFKEEQQSNEKKQQLQVQDLLKEWTLNISTSTQSIIKEALVSPPDTELANALLESQERRSKIVQVGTPAVERLHDPTYPIIAVFLRILKMPITGNYKY